MILSTRKLLGVAGSSNSNSISNSRFKRHPFNHQHQHLLKFLSWSQCHCQRRQHLTMRNIQYFVTCRCHVQRPRRYLVPDPIQEHTTLFDHLQQQQQSTTLADALGIRISLDTQSSLQRSQPDFSDFKVTSSVDDIHVIFSVDFSFPKPPSVRI